MQTIIDAFSTLDSFRKGYDVDDKTLKDCIHFLLYYVESLEIYSTGATKKKSEKDVFNFFYQGCERKTINKKNKKNVRVREYFSDTMRWDILVRDGFKCQKCGRTIEDGIKLQVDHIVSRKNGGMATMENGQTLCNQCNRGKWCK